MAHLVGATKNRDTDATVIANLIQLKRLRKSAPSRNNTFNVLMEHPLV